MKLKFAFLILLFSISLFKVMAQSDALKAQSAYLNAEEAYQQSKFSEAVDFLNSAKTLLGKTNGKIQYLLVKSLKSANRFDDAKKELATYFDVTPEDTQDEKYREMVQNITLLDKLKVQNEELAKAKEKEKQLANEQAEKAKQQQEQNRLLQLEIAKTIENDMVLVEGGTYRMQTHDAQQSHKVTLNNFYCGKYEITQKQWVIFMGANPSNHKDCLDCPVENISWNEIQIFINKLNEVSGKNFRLLTDAEWEYAIEDKAEYSHFFSLRNNINDYAWIDNVTYPVGKKKASNIGTFDMIGNVAEFCLDNYSETFMKNSPKDNPINTSETGKKVVRGITHSAMDTSRFGFFPFTLGRAGVGADEKSALCGFRLGRSN